MEGNGTFPILLIENVTVHNTKVRKIVSKVNVREASLYLHDLGIHLNEKVLFFKTIQTADNVFYLQWSLDKCINTAQ